MSALAAIVHDAGSAPDPALLRAMLQPIAYRGGDRTGLQGEGGALLGIAQRCVTAEDREADQPLGSADSGLLAIFDGFLGNCDDLRRDLIAAGCRPRGRSDVELVTLAYQTWGTAFAERLDGEFALVLWDPRRRMLLAARDPVGARPLVYWCDDRTLLIASDVAAILAGLPERPPLEQAYLLQTLTGLHYCSEDTPWQGVRRLPPGHLLTLSGGTVQEAPYWEPDLEAQLVFRTDAEYEEQHRTVLSECVRRWSRSAGPVAYHVSGGLDSSAIFAVADRLLRQGDLPAPAVQGFAFAAPRGTEADEERYSRAVERQVGRPVTRVPLTMPSLEAHADEAFADADGPPYPNGTMIYGLTAAAVASGCRVHVGGLGGDNWLDGTHDYYRQELAAGRWRHVLADLRADRAAIGVRATASRFVRSGLGRLLPPAAERMIRELTGRQPWDDLGDLDWLTRDALDILAQRRAAFDAMLERYPAAHRYKMRKLRQPGFQESLRHMDRQTARLGGEIRSPLFSRSFIQFACAVPERQRLRANRTKDIHRRAMRGILPPEVCNRSDKAYFTVVFQRLFEDLDRFVGGKVPPALAALMSSDDPSAMLHLRYGEIDSWPPYPVWNIYSAWLLAQQQHQPSWSQTRR